jgi:peptide/nickel transport system permease protein
VTVFPGLPIVLIVICINFMGDGLRDALDPQQRRVRA